MEKDVNADYSAHRFLIADDKAFLRSTIQGMLLRCKADVIKHAANGKEAISVLAKARGNVDCLLCDWNMEPIDGLQLLQTIRTGGVHRTPRDLPVIMLTGHANELVVKLAVALDVSGYLVKPVPIGRLVRAIDNAFAKPIELKSAAAYKAIHTARLPGSVDSTVKRTPPWVLWARARERGHDKLIKQVEVLHLEAADLATSLHEHKRAIIKKEHLDLHNIAPGKILAEDITGEDGTLLLAAGVVLNANLLERLHEMAAESETAVQLWVGVYDS